MPPDEAFAKVEAAIRTLRNKFLEFPFMFYTESAMHCYLYHLLYQGETFKKEFDVRVGKDKQIAKTILLHKEYPTLGKFYKRQKDRRLIPCEEEYIVVGNKRLHPSRGAYDLAIIDPDPSRSFKWQRTSIAIELALNEVHPTLWHLENDYRKITYTNDKVDRGYILFFIRRRELSQGKFIQLPQLRNRVKSYEKDLDPKVRILYLEAPKLEQDSEIRLPSGWKV